MKEEPKVVCKLCSKEMMTQRNIDPRCFWRMDTVHVKCGDWLDEVFHAKCWKDMKIY